MQIIAIPREENDILADERTRLSAWAGPNRWAYIEYADAFDLLSRLSDLQATSSDPITEIEIVAHGNPSVCDDILSGNAGIVGESLRRITGVMDTTVVYLSGCNTGLEFNEECIARTFAMAAKVPVFGARGYIMGTRAERTERCVASFELEGIVYHAYRDAADATGEHVWKAFGPSRQATGGGDMQIKIATSGFRAVTLGGAEGDELVSAVEQILRSTPVRSARVRMAPDLTFAIRLADGEHVFELLAGGTVLRDPVTRNVWQFERGREILQTLLPYRKLPAA